MADPTYHAIKAEIEKVQTQLLEMRENADEMTRVRIDCALQKLEVSAFALGCGQTQSALDPGAPPAPGTEKP